MRFQRNGITYERTRDTDDVFLPVLETVAKTGSVYARIIAVLVVGMLCSTTIAMAQGAAGETIAYFRDSENSSGNVFRAGLLGFRVDTIGEGFAFEAAAESAGGYHTALVVPESGSIPMQYKISVEKTAGSDVFCGALHASATSTVFTYDGSLLAMGTTTTQQGPFDFGVTLSGTDGLIDGDTCSLDIVYIGWSSSNPSPFGYTDMFRVPMSFSYSNPEPVIEPAALRSAETSGAIEEVTETADVIPVDTPNEVVTPEENATSENTAAEVPPTEETPEPVPAATTEIETTTEASAEPAAAVETPPALEPEPVQQ